MKNSSEELIKKVDIQKIAAEGAKIYENLGTAYKSQHGGQFLAIDPKSKEIFLGKTSARAVELARQAHPGQVFYVVKIGFSAAETLASLTKSEV